MTFEIIRGQLVDIFPFLWFGLLLALCDSFLSPNPQPARAAATFEAWQQFPTDYAFAPTDSINTDFAFFLLAPKK
jgi:hypothetical protein